MTVPVNRMENLTASGSVSGSLKVSSAGSPSSSSSSSSPQRRQTSPHLSLPGRASGSFGCSRLPGCRCERGRGGWAAPRSGRAPAPAARSARGGEAEPVPGGEDRASPGNLSSAVRKRIADVLLNCIYHWIGVGHKKCPFY